MVQRLLLLPALLLLGFTLNAQLPDPCPTNQEPPAEDCFSACIYCNFNNIQSTTSIYSQGSAPGFCGTIENDQWLGFIAGLTTTATFTATPSNCTLGNGVQIALYSSCSASPLQCYGGAQGGANTPATITVPVTSGVNYFLLVDGYAGDQCDFTISVVPPAAVQAPNVGPSGVIQGPTSLCPGAVVTYTLPVVTGAGAYVWEAPAGYLINGEPPPVTVTAPGGNVVQITIGPNGGQICVTPLNSCDDGNKVCKNVTVAPIPPTILPPAIVCAEDVPYELPWGDVVFTSGTYQYTETSWLGCDSLLKKTVTIKPPIIKNLSPMTICEGDFITVCGEQYFNGGNYTTTCESYQGCDSIVNFSLTVLDVVANITGGGTISCSTNSILLSSDPSPNGTKTWKNGMNQVLGTGNTLTVSQPGTYILTTTAQQGGVVCSEADTITIAGNTTQPTVSAINGVLGCGTPMAQLGATTNATNPTFSWSGPGGFTSSLQNPIVTAPGTYIVTVTNVGGNGCTNTASATVVGNTTPPGASATGGTLTCSTTSILINASSIPTATFSWSGPGGFTSTLPNPSVTVPGNYFVTATDPSNGCTSASSAVVNLNNTAPGATASVAGVIGCNTPMVTLNGNSPTTGVTYAWTGPSGFTSAVQSPQAGTAGAYIVTVTNPANGCTSTATANLTGNTTAPNVSATGGGISCGTPTVALTGGSTTAGATYSWSGPGGFTSTQQNPVASAVGTYTLTVTAPNACTSTATATVNGDFAVPNASATGGIITCASSSTTISGTSTTPGATYSWTGPGNFMSNLQSPVVSSTGDYILTVAGPNGCTAADTATVMPDANVPNATASGGTLDCNISSITLNGSSTTAGATLSWAGPGGFTSSSANPTVSVDGVYTLTVNNPANGCTAQATATVDLDIAQPGASATGGILTCTNPALDLAGTSPASSVTWSWTGPGGFTSTSQNPNISVGGTYDLTVTGTNGCTSTASATVNTDQTAPVLTSTGGTLTCDSTSIFITSSTTLPGTYSWTGPGGFTSLDPNPTAIVPGTYDLVVTAANGCTGTTSAVIAQDITPPDVAVTGNTIDCNNPQVGITSSSNTVGVNYAWTGVGGFASNLQNPTVAEPGDYIVTVTATNGCSSTEIATVGQNLEVATLDAQSPDILTCSAQTVTVQGTITASANSSIQTISWSGPNAFASTLEDPDVSEPGTYSLTVTQANGCTSEAQVTVDQDITTPDVIVVGGTVTCATPSIPVDGNSQTAGATFAWTGPNGFASPLEDPMVTDPGDYIVTVTGPNGCTSTATANVAQDIAPPGANIALSNGLDCTNTTAVLQGSSPISSVTYAWGPAGSLGDTPEIMVSTPNTYDLVVTGPNGCTSTASVIVPQDINPPNATAVGDTIDCVSGNASLMGNSPTAGVTWQWTGPGGFSSPDQNPVVSTDGPYTLTVTGPNGCTSTASTVVAKNDQSPVASITGDGTLTCVVTSITLTGNIGTAGATGVWNGPNGFTSTTPTIDAVEPGTYAWVVTATNGCLSQPGVTLLKNVDPPSQVAANGGVLNCTNPTISLTGSSSSVGVTYSWTGPGGFTSSQQNPPVSNPGDYMLVVTDPANGCTASAVATVTLDPDIPDITVAADTLTCAQPTALLKAVTNTAGVNFTWSGPGITNPALQNQSISVPGTYDVTVTNPVNGCKSFFTVVIPEDKVEPGATATGGIKTCTQPTVPISATSPTQNVTYSWTGPGGFSSNQANPTVGEVGDYVVTVTNPVNGCTSVATATITPDANLPVVTTTGGTITCKDPTVQLGATSSNPNVTWQWTGPNGFNSTVQNPTASEPGSYTAQATAPNGCFDQSTTTVLDNTDGPNLTAETADELNCTTTQVTLSVTAAPLGGSYAYSWTTTDGNITAGSLTPTPTVTQSGSYTVVVTDNQNGCTSLISVPVTNDPATPSGAAIAVDSVSCFGKTDGSFMIDSIVGGTAPFVYSVDNQPFTAAPLFTSLPPGSHTVVVQDANGCEWQTTVPIYEPEELIVNLGPDTTIHLGNTITLSLDNTVNFPDRVEQTLLTPPDLSLGIDTPLFSFKYMMTVVDANGCKASDDRTVIVNKKRLVYIPSAFSPESGSGNELLSIYVGEDVKRIKSFRIYDRWGEAVYEIFDFYPSAVIGWDGSVRGDKATPAVFVYYAEVEFIDGETVLYKGDVTLVRK